MEKTIDLHGAFDIIIIGAGISGSTAAYNLKKSVKNLRILMIEGKGRVGGRTETIEKKSAVKEGKATKWDLGGQWVSSGQRHVTKVLDELNIPTFKQYTGGKKVLELNGKVTYQSKDESSSSQSLLNALDMKNYVNTLNEINDRIDVAQPFAANDQQIQSLDHKNFKDYLESIAYTPAVRALATSNIRGIVGLETDQVNGLYGLTYVKAGVNMATITGADKGEAQESRIVGGAQQITEKLLECVQKNSTTKESEFKLLLNTQLMEIIQKEDNSDDLVQVVTRNILTNEFETFKCRKVISSIPINQYINVKFTPELPLYKRNCFKFVQVGNFTKFIVTYKTPFWRAKGLSGETSSDGSNIHLTEDKFKQVYGKQVHKLSFNKTMPSVGAVVETFDNSDHDDEPAIVGFIAGDAVTQWGDLADEIRKTEIIESLARYFGPEARDYVEFIEKNWAYEPFAGGCPSLSVISCSAMKDYARATREPFMNVHMCGTESATEWIGYMNGAVESGERVANEVLYALSYGANNYLPANTPVEFEKTYYFQKKQTETNARNKEIWSKSLKKHNEPFHNKFLDYLYKLSVGISLGGYTVIGHSFRKMFNLF